MFACHHGLSLGLASALYVLLPTAVTTVVSSLK
jgi:hypothetical protein